MLLVGKIVRDPLPTIPRGYSDFVRQLFSEMLNRNPRLRPTAGTILKRPRIQGIIKQMLDQAATEQVAAIRTYQKGELVDYYSQSHGSWLPAVVICVDEDGRIEVDLKPGMRIPQGQVAHKLRPRQSDTKQDKDVESMADLRNLPRPESTDSQINQGCGIGICRSSWQDDPEFMNLCEELGIDQDVEDGRSIDETLGQHHLVKTIPDVPENNAVFADIAEDDLVQVEDALKSHPLSMRSHPLSMSAVSLTAAEMELLAEVGS